jgi:hypothetical protein
MNKILQYREPDEMDSIKIIRVAPQDAIDSMKQYAYRHGYTYSNDQDALDEFMAVNWAYWVEE